MNQFLDLLQKLITIRNELYEYPVLNKGLIEQMNSEINLLILRLPINNKEDGGKFLTELKN